MSPHGLLSILDSTKEHPAVVEEFYDSDFEQSIDLRKLGKEINSSSQPHPLSTHICCPERYKVTERTKCQHSITRLRV